VKLQPIAALTEQVRTHRADWQAQQLALLSDQFARISEETTILLDEKLQRIQRLVETYSGPIAQAKKEALEWRRQRAPEYNIFKLLGREKDEEATHTPFLCDLLDPRGKHSQEHIFLETFLKMCAEKKDQYGRLFPVTPDQVHTGRWHVRSERKLYFKDPTLYGKVDIILWNDQSRVLIIIENKIYSSEQSDQLYRYSKWMDEQDSLYEYRALLYLTPNGDNSYTSHGRSYYPVSYRSDISDWLTSTLTGNLEQKKDFKIPNKLAVVLQQYLEIIRNI
jgi:hypothetical protein